MTTPDITQEDLERARELRGQIDRMLLTDSYGLHEPEEIIAAALAAARAEGERKGIERAAKLMEKAPPGGWRSWKAAAAIRALIPQEPGSNG